MSFYARLGLLSIFGVALLSTSSSSSAQVIDDHNSGYPIQLRVVVIQSGTTTRFRTDYNLELAPGASNADTVLSLIQIGGGFLGGADGWDCSGATFTWGPSCFDYTNNSGTTQVAYLVARSWSPNSPSRGRLWRDSAYLPDNYNGNSTDKVWFGGDWVTQPIASSGRQHLSTTHRPGGAVRHLMVIGSDDAYNSAEVVHRIEFGTSPIVWGLAELDQIGSGSLPANVGIAYGGRNRTNFGPVRLLKNNWFASGADHDGDGLGHALEVNLGTCDRPSDTMPNGQGCASLELCTSNPTSDVCMARLRDTDQDGLRDDVEVYGYDDPLTHMPRYGANPVHRDVFIEMQTVDRVSGNQDCDGFADDPNISATWPVRMGQEPNGSDNDFFDRFQRIYDQAPADMNPDGNPGIEIHIDVGIANPDPLSTAWNDWGDGNDCVAASVNACATAMDPDRRWLFRCAVDSGGWGGSARAQAQGYWAGRTHQHVHELAHVLGLDHSGPYGSAANTIDAANKRPLFVSRANYRYEQIGTNGTGVWDDISFSYGLLSTPTNARFASEQEPIPGADLSALTEAQPVALATSSTPGVWDVDWNQDGVVNSGQRVWEAYRELENGRNARGYKSKWPHQNLLTGNYGDHMDTAISNGVLVLAFSEDDHIYFMANSDGECDLLPSAANPGERSSYPDCMALGSRFNTSHTAQAVSIARTLLPGSSNPPPLPDTEGMVMVYRDGKYLYWREVDVTPNTAAPAQAGFQISGGGILTYVGYGPHQVTLAEVPASTSNPHGGVMAFVVENSGNLRQAFLPAGSSTWSSFGDVQLSGGGGTFGQVAGTVGAVPHDGLLYMAARSVGDAEIRIYTMSGGSNQTGKWTEVDNFSAPGAEAIEIAFVPKPTGEMEDELFVFYRDLSGTAPEIRQRRWPKWIYDAQLGTSTQEWSDATPMGLTAEEYSFASAAVVYDQRSVVGEASGLRAFRNTHRGCAANPAVGCTAGYHPGTTNGDMFCDGTYCSDTPPTCVGPAGTLGCVCGGAGCNSGLRCESVQLPGGAVNLCVDEGVRSYVQYSPFAEGHNPTEYCDYDDWEVMGWFMCEGLSGISAPMQTSDFVRTPYQSTSNPDDPANVRCGNRIVHAEPNSTGACAADYVTTVNDRTLFPNYYDSDYVKVYP